MPGLRFAPETGVHSPRMRASVFSVGPGHWILRVVASNGCAGEAVHPTQDAAMAGWPALYAELTGQHTVQRGSASEQVVMALLPGYAPS